MPRDAIACREIAPPVGPFSPAVRSGEFVFLSGQVGQDPLTSKLVAGGTAAQTEQIFTNLDAVLRASGKTFADVAQVRVYLTELADYAAVNAIYGRHFEAPYPARTAIGVAALPLGASVEIDLVARQHVPVPILARFGGWLDGRVNQTPADAHREREVSAQIYFDRHPDKRSAPAP